VASSDTRCVVIVGPTAVGKTKLGIEVAKAFGGEVINGDAMQVYRELNIGTAKVTPEEAEGIPHHLIDILEPTEEYTVAAFQQDARRLITSLNRDGKLPVLVGGTGLYVKAALYDYQFNEASEDSDLRQALQKRAKDEGPDVLYKELIDVDPGAAERIHPNNVQRVIRALEIYQKTGKAMSEHLPIESPELVMSPIIIGLTMDRSLLYERINGRVDLMVQQGLIEEAKSLYEKGIRKTQAVMAIGYKELFGAFDGEYTLEEAIDLIKKNSRRFAKRQLTWFRHQMPIDWFDVTDYLDSFEKKVEEIIDFIAGKLEKRSN
jgi:tRNA dimethylallyltransferase